LPRKAHGEGRSSRHRRGEVSGQLTCGRHEQNL
jgi:hypothetical protein